MGTNTRARPVKVAVLGGGVAGLAAAFELSDPRHNGKFQVTLHQLGWRLGGKCASGRDLDTARRTKEHGPHILFGFYDNAFAILREAYKELAGPGRVFQTIEDALVAHNSLVAMEQQDDGSWDPWVFDLPVMSGQPGDIMPQHEERAFDALVRMIERQVTELAERQLSNPAALHTNVGMISTLGAVKLQATVLTTASPDQREAEAASLTQHLRKLQGIIQAETPEPGHVPAWLQRLLRRLRTMADLAIATAIGMAVDHLIWPTRQSVAAANEFEYRAWLLKHGAAPPTANSAIIRALYDTVFAYPGGDVTAPGNVEAGSAVLTQKGLISYRGSPCYKMRTGTGDVTAAPIYEVLIKRGVTVNFFHRVDDLVPADDGSIESICIGVQATLKSGSYQPLIDVKGLPAWPDRPLYDQLVQGEALKDGKIDLESFWTPWKDPAPPIVLSRSAGDFDKVVLAIPVGALGYITTKLAQPGWQKMLNGASTVPTQCVQVWLDRDTGWSSTTTAPVVTGYDRAAIDTWLDASEVIPFEDWQAPVPLHMAILCGPMPVLGAAPPPSDYKFPASQANRVANAGLQFLGQVAPLWPALTNANGFDWSAISAPANSKGPLRFQEQYWAAAINPSDRYVLTLAGSSKNRLQPGGSGYSNLYLAGDWTDYSLNLGCFEGSVMSGLMAANAFSGDPRKIMRYPFSGELTMPDVMRAPGYIDYPSVQTLPGPIAFSGVRMSAFPLAADFGTLQALCDSLIATPTGGRVRFTPLPIVMMAFTEFPHSVFVNFPDRGVATERELSFAIPGIYSRLGGEFGFAMFMPFLFLDNPVALMTGRENYGFFKQTGKIGMPDDPGNPGFSADVYGCPTYSPTAQWGQQRLVTLRRIDKATPGPALGLPWPDPMAAAQKLAAAMQAMAGGATIAPEAFGDFLTGKLPQIFLKQFRDIADGTRACYQAVTMAHYQVTKLINVSFEDRYAIDLKALDSTPVAAALGLAPAKETSLGMRIEMDMQLENGRVLWQA